MSKKTQKDKNRPVENRSTIFEKERREKQVAKLVLAEAKKLETQLGITHRWIKSADGKTKKLVKI